MNNLEFERVSDTTRALLNLTQPTATELDRLRSQLASTAHDRGVLDIGYTTIDTPVGSLLLAATGSGLVRVAYEREGFDSVLETLATRISPRVLRAPKWLDTAVREIDEYFAGRRTEFHIPLDFALSTGFRRVVQEYLPGIPYGVTQSYKDVATVVGRPKAIRAVGTACATNPLPVVVPCHRVLRADGSLGGYVGGSDAKSTLLTLEAAA